MRFCRATKVKPVPDHSEIGPYLGSPRATSGEWIVSEELVVKVRTDVLVALPHDSPPLTFVLERNG